MRAWELVVLLVDMIHHSFHSMQILTLSISKALFTATWALDVRFALCASYVACQESHCPDHQGSRQYGQTAIWAMCLGFCNLSFAGTGAGSSG